jgi:dihydrofolate reductase
MKVIALIAALDENNGLGAGNNLLWHLPDDFKWFKQHTTGKPVIMGRKTMNSLGNKPLPKRKNIVISSNANNVPEGFEFANSLYNSLQLAENETDEVMVIGGGNIYTQFLGMATHLIITRIHYTFPEMDTFFPKWDENEWKLSFQEHHEKDDRHAYAFDFLIYERVR